MTIIFYDIPCSKPNTPWSVNTWKIRFALNYKQIPYTTEWVEYPNIENLCKKLQIKPTSKKPDGRDHYTIPAIHDTSTGVRLADSILIAEYLDKTYPKTPPLFPYNTLGLQMAFQETFWELFTPIIGFVMPVMERILNPASKEYFRRTREADLGTTLEGFMPKGQNAVELWTKLQTNFDRIDGWYAKTDELGPFVMGSEISWSDIIVASHLISLREIWGEDHQRWKEFNAWNGGRWKSVMQLMEKYTVVS